jgi:hypothetical protein
MRSRQPNLRQHLPSRILRLVFEVAIATSWAAAPAGAASLTAMTDSCSHVTQHVTVLQTENCVFDNETGIDTPPGPHAIANILDPFKDPNVNPTHPYDYLGQATAQAVFGAVGTFVEVQVENANPTDMVATPIDVTGTTIRAGGASASAESRDTLTFSAGTTVRFGFKLSGPAVAVCPGAGGGGGPCDQKLGSAQSKFSAIFNAPGGAPGVLIERDDLGGVVSTNIGPFGTLDPSTGVLLSDPVSIIDPLTRHIVPIEVVMDSSSSAGSRAFDPDAAVQTTRAVADFLDTATLSKILVFDSDGNLIPDVSITSASGTIYPIAAPEPPAAMPEPSTFQLIAVACGILGGVWRWRVRA